MIARCMMILLALVLPATARTFTDPLGRKMEAEIVSASGDSVTLLRDDGKKVTVKTSELSKADREHIATWIAENPGAALGGKLDLRVSQIEGEREGSDRELLYRIELKNNGDAALSDLQLSYRVYSKGPNSLDMVSREDAVRIPTLPAGKTAMAESFVVGTGRSWRDIDEKVGGIWLRAHVRGKLVVDQKTELRPGALSEVEWVDQPLGDWVYSELGGIVENPKESVAVLHRSPLITPESKSRATSCSVDLEGATHLILVVDQADDTTDCDHGVWIEPTLKGSYGEKSLTELSWERATSGWKEARVNLNMNDNQPGSKGEKFDQAIVAHAQSIIVYTLPEGTTSFRTDGALEDMALRSWCAEKSTLHMIVCAAFAK